ncbi:hypothetical protein A2U01_0100233, partial [Trifolium medium]|nr:hypothetical protein [Trifolium medium]
MSEKRNAGQNRSKPYDKPRENQGGKHKATYERETSGGWGYNPPRCFRCGGTGHKIAKCKTT